MPASNLPDLVDNVDIDRIRIGNGLATADAVSRMLTALNRTISQLEQLSQQAVLVPLYCRLYKASQTIQSATDTFVAWDTPPVAGNVTTGVNVGGMFDAVGPVSSGAAGGSYVTLHDPGLYLIEANVLWDTNVVGDRKVEIVLLGSLATLDCKREPASVTSAIGLKQTVQALVAWRALGETWNGNVAIRVWQNSGGARTIGDSTAACDQWLGVTRVGAIR